MENRAEELAIFHKIKTIMNNNKQKRTTPFALKSNFRDSPMTARFTSNH